MYVLAVRISPDLIAFYGHLTIIQSVYPTKLICMRPLFTKKINIIKHIFIIFLLLIIFINLYQNYINPYFLRPFS